jgi:phospho-N-acetylmuramoyl-pentapeptide-transferase
MGGIIILLPVIVLTVAFNLIDRWSILLPLAVLVAFAILGAIDDYMSLVGSRSKTYGFTPHTKMALMLLIAFGAALALYLPPPFGLANFGQCARSVCRAVRHRSVVHSVCHADHCRHKQCGEPYRWSR